MSKSTLPKVTPPNRSYTPDKDADEPVPSTSDMSKSSAKRHF